MICLLLSFIMFAYDSQYWCVQGYEILFLIAVFSARRDMDSIHVSVAIIVGFDLAENDWIFVMYVLNYIFAHIFVEFPSLFNSELKLSRLGRKHIISIRPLMLLFRRWNQRCDAFLKKKKNYFQYFVLYTLLKIRLWFQARRRSRPDAAPGRTAIRAARCRTAGRCRTVAPALDCRCGGESTTRAWATNNARRFVHRVCKFKEAPDLALARNRCWRCP